MKKYVMNKLVHHNGKPYVKGQEIKKGDDGFEALVSGGHAEVIEFRGDGEPMNESVAEAQAEGGESEPSEKASGKRRR